MMHYTYLLCVAMRFFADSCDLLMIIILSFTNYDKTFIKFLKHLIKEENCEKKGTKTIVFCALCSNDIC